MLPTWVFVVCVLAAWWGRKDVRMLTVILVATVFGATAALELTVLGSAPVVPAVFFIPLLMLTLLRLGGWKAVSTSFHSTAAVVWLFAFVAWAVFSAVFAPRFFEGKVLVYAMSRNNDLGVQLQPLGPISSNITQSAYLVAGLIAFAALVALCRRAGAAKAVLDGLCAVATVNLVAAAMNMVEGYLGLKLGLEFIRNANYAILENDRAHGLLRIQGTFSETSSFSSFSLALFAALMICWRRGLRPRWTGPLCIAHLLLLLLSTSTTAYVAMMVVLAGLMAVAIASTLLSPDKVRFGGISILVLLLVAGGCLVVLLAPDFVQRIGDIFRGSVLLKLDSDSGRERSSWTQQTWESFIGTYGIGTGAGSSRGSSWAIVILGNTGVIGAITFAGFMIATLSPWNLPRSDELRTLALAFKLATAACFVAASISGTMIDPGIMFWTCAGLAAGLGVAERVGRRSHDPPPLHEGSTAVAATPSARPVGQ